MLTINDECTANLNRWQVIYDFIISIIEIYSLNFKLSVQTTTVQAN